MKCFGIFHKWKYVKQPYKDLFLQEIITEKYSRFRICQRCGKCQGHPRDEIPRWVFIDETKAKVLKSKIEDKGDYYLLPEEDCPWIKNQKKSKS